MQGVIFNLLEQVVVAEHDEDTWDDLLEDAGSDGVFASVGRYDDEQLLALVRAAGERLGRTDAEVLAWFGHRAIGRLADAYPVFFEDAGSLRPFLLSLNDVIHREVRKLYPGAVVPTFSFADGEDGALLLTYSSPRRLCALAEGFVTGAAEHFDEPVVVTQERCLLRGDDACVLGVRWTGG